MGLSDIGTYAKNWWLTGGIIGIMAVLLSKLYGWIAPNGLGVLKFGLEMPLELDLRSQVLAGWDTSLGAKILGFINGIVPVDAGGLTVWIGVIITGIIVVVLGRTIFSLVPMGGNTTAKFMWIVFYGAVAMGLINSYLVNQAFPDMGTMAHLLIMHIMYALIISWVYVNLVAKLIGQNLPN